MTTCWLIEVVYDPSDGRAPRYFTGACDPGWQGHTTLIAYLAQRYGTKEAAERDIATLMPRLLGVWRAIEHGFHE